MEDHPKGPWTRDSIEAHTHGDWDGHGLRRALFNSIIIVLLIIAAIYWAMQQILGITALGAWK